MLAIGPLASAAFVGVLLFHSTADAKPKKSFGCSMQQIQSAEAAPCIAKADDDILKGRPYTHVVYCSSTGKLLCCRADSETSQIIDHSCSLGFIRPGGGSEVPLGTLKEKAR
jgi:hypothetical protein